MDASSSSQPQPQSEPTETTALLSSNSHHSGSPDVEGLAGGEAVGDGAVSTRTARPKWVLAGTWSSLLAAILALAFGMAIVVMNAQSPRWFHMSLELRNLVPVVSAFSIVALILAGLNLWPTSSTSRPILATANLVIDALIAYYVGAFAMSELNFAPGNTYCGRPWDDTPDPELPKCRAFRDKFVIVAGFYVAFALILCIAHAFLFIMRFVQLCRAVNLDRPNEDGVVSSLRLTVGHVAVEANVKILGSGNGIYQGGGVREHGERA